MDEIPITGYADRFSLAPGEKINFKISSTSNDPYRAKLIRVISGDPNPEGPGLIEEDIESDFSGVILFSIITTLFPLKRSLFFDIYLKSSFIL